MEIIDITDNDVQETKYKCNLCDLHSRSKHYIENHKRQKHTNEGEVIRCNLCQETFSWNTSLGNHMKTIHNENLPLLQCRYCDLKTKNIYHMRKHEKRHLGSDMYQKCNECGKCLNGSSMRKHLKDHEKVNNPDLYKFKCGECKYITFSEHLLDKHNKLKHSKFAKSCNYCSYKTPSERRLLVHISKGHIELKCPYLLCDYKTIKKHAFHFHKIFSHPFK